MNAPTLAQLAVANPPDESLWHFLAQIPASMEAQIFYALTIGAAVGMIIHYTKQWLEQDIAGSLYDYLFRQSPRRTALAIFGILSWSVAEVSTGLFTTEAGVFVGWALVILSGLKTGYVGDSAFNKAIRPVWTDQQRAAKTVVPAVQPTQGPTP